MYLDEVAKRISPTTGEWGQKDPYYACYLVGSNTSIQFWVRDTAPEAERGEIFMVVEKSSSTDRIIWPADLVGTDIESAKRKEWPKMYK